MKHLMLEPNGWPCPLHECPPGLFACNGSLCFKSEYAEGVYCNTGEAFWGGTTDTKERALLEVQPLKAVWYRETDGVMEREEA